MQGKANDLNKNSSKIGLKIHPGKTKVMKVRSNVKEHIIIQGNEVEEVESYSYLGSSVTIDGNSEKVNTRLNKARYTFAALRSVWNNRNISTKTKVRIYNTNVLSVLLYACETWKITKNISHNIEVFQNRCLRRIFRIYWPDMIKNEELLKMAQLPCLTSEVKRRRWKWIGHVLRMKKDATPRTALHWTPEGKRPRGRPKETWRRTVEKEREEEGWTWGLLQRKAEDRSQWRALVEALYADGTKRIK